MAHIFYVSEQDLDVIPTGTTVSCTPVQAVLQFLVRTVKDCMTGNPILNAKMYIVYLEGDLKVDIEDYTLDMDLITPHPVKIVGKPIYLRELVVCSTGPIRELLLSKTFDDIDAWMSSYRAQNQIDQFIAADKNRSSVYAKFVEGAKADYTSALLTLSDELNEVEPAFQSASIAVIKGWTLMENKIIALEEIIRNALECGDLEKMRSVLLEYPLDDDKNASG